MKLARPPSGGLTPPTASKIHKKERVLHALTRMNDRDTQKSAAEDLLAIVRNLDQEGLPIILSCLCTTGADQKVYARKECARALGVIASEVCPLRDKALQQPYLGKMLTQLRKSLQDADSSVRDASSEALALVAQGLTAAAAAGGGEPPGGGLSNPVLKLLFECLVEQRKDLNAAACAALGMAAPYLGTLEPGLAKELVRKLGSSTFQAPAALAAALARTDPLTGEPLGLIKSGPGAFVPLLPALVGQPAAAPGGGGGTGATGLLSRSDWPVRQAAADMLRAVALLLGPLVELEGCWALSDPRCLTGRAMRALEPCRFDKVPNVREVSRGALAVVEELHAYGSAGGSAAGWPAHIYDKLQGKGPAPPAMMTPPATNPAAAPYATPPQPALASAPPPGPSPSSADPFPLPPGPTPSPPPNPLASSGSYPSGLSPYPLPGRKSPLRRSSPSIIPPARRSPAPAERRSTPSPVFQRQGSLADRFRAAHGNADSVHDPLGRYENKGGEQGLGATEAAAADPSGLAERPSQQLFQDLPLPEGAPPAAAGSVAGSAGQGPGGPGAGSAPGSRALSRNPSIAASASGRPSGAMAVEPQFSVRSRDSQRPPPDDPSYAGVQTGVGPPTAGPTGLPRSDSAASRHSQAAAPPPVPLNRSTSGAMGLSNPGPGLPSSPGPGLGTNGSLGRSASPPPDPAALGLGPTVTLSTEEWLAQQQRLRNLEAQQRRLLEEFKAMADSSANTIAALQAKVRALEAQLDSPGLGPSYGALPPLQLPARSSSPPLPATHPQPSHASPLPAVDSEPSSAWTPQAPPPASPLAASVSASGSIAAGRLAAYAYDNGGVASPRVSVQLPNGDGPGSSSGSGGSDVRAMYREALSGGGGMAEMALLRLMQRTKPVWNELGYELCTQLLAAFVGSLQARPDGPLVARMVPWLYRLADDEHNRYEAPHELRVALLAGLRAAVPVVTDPQLFEKLGLLVSTLQTNWNMPPDVPAAPQPAPWQSAARTPPPVPPSPAAVPSLQAPAPVPAFPPSASASTLPVYGSGPSPVQLPQAQSAVPVASPAAAAEAQAAAVPAVSRSVEGPVAAAAAGQVQGSPAGLTPRAGGALRAMAAPSINTLMGDFSNLQKELAAMNTPRGGAGTRAMQ